jgi:hypothetical protein
MKKKITAWISQAVSIFSRSLTNIGKETSSTSTGVRAWSQIGDLLLGHATGDLPAVGGGEWILRETDCEYLEQSERHEDHRSDDLLFSPHFSPIEFLSVI